MYLHSRIGSGSFGTVYKGKWHGRNAFQTGLGPLEVQLAALFAFSSCTSKMSYLTRAGQR